MTDFVPFCLLVYSTLLTIGAWIKLLYQDDVDETFISTKRPILAFLSSCNR